MPTLTYLFVDQADSTRQLRRLGDDVVAPLRGQMKRVLRACISQHNGTEIDDAGDGIFAAFSSVFEAVDAALEMHAAMTRMNESRVADRSIGIRIGVEVGEAVVEEGKHIGLVVHTSARLCAAAPVGETLVGPVAHGILENRSALHFRARKIHAKGLPQSFKGWQVLARDRDPSAWELISGRASSFLRSTANGYRHRIPRPTRAFGRKAILVGAIAVFGTAIAGQMLLTSGSRDESKIYTVAGQLAPQAGPLPASFATTSGPTALAISTNLGLLVAESSTGRILRERSDGTVSVLIGPVASHPSYAMPGHLGELVYPRGVAAGPNGNVYVADPVRDRVFELSQGRIRAVRNSKNETRFRDPYAVAVAPDGTLFIGERGAIIEVRRERARQIFPPRNDKRREDRSVVVTAIAPSPSGDLYFADAQSSRVFRRSPTGAITRVAGNGRRAFDGDGGLATEASLNTPGGIALDPQGDLYIADTVNDRIRKIDRAGIITTYVGSGRSLTASGPPSGALTEVRLDRPTGLVFDAVNVLFIAETDGNRLDQVNSQGQFGIQIGGPPNGKSRKGQLWDPKGVCVDSRGRVLIADTNNNVIRRVTAGGTLETLAGTGTRGTSGDGGPAKFAQLNGPSSIAVTHGGTVLFADTQNNRIRSISTDGTISTLAGTGVPGYSGDLGPASAATLNHPYGVAVGPDDYVYIADTDNNAIRRVVDGQIETIAGTGQPGEQTNGRDGRLTPLDHPMSVAPTADGTVFFSDSGNDAVRVVRRNGTVANIASSLNSGSTPSGAQDSELYVPSAIAWDPAGYLYIASYNAKVIFKIVVRTGEIARAVGTLTRGASGDGEVASRARIGRAGGLAVEADHLFVADTNNNRVLSVGPQP
jgi:class 3 adenylate cyclase/streptogramin lyase